MDTIRRKLFVYIAVPTVTLAALAAWESQRYEYERARGTRQAHMSERAAHHAGAFDGHLREIAQIARSTATFVSGRSTIDEEGLYTLLEANLAQNELVYGAAIAYEPHAFAADRRLFSPYVYRLSSGGTARLDIGASYDYTAPGREWYEGPRGTGEALWTDPYFDEGAAEALMSTFSVPFHRDGQIRGITTVDIALPPLQELVARRIGADRRFAILTAEGKFVYHPDPDRILSGTMDEGLLADRSEVERVTRQVTSGGTGLLVTDGWEEAAPTWLAYAPIDSPGWSFVQWVPEAEVMEDIDARARAQAAGVVGLIGLMAGIIWVTARRLSAPLEALTQTASRIAEGDLEARADVAGRDEIGTLARTVNDMAAHLQERDLALADQRRQRFGELLDGMSGRYFHYTHDRDGVFTYVSPSVTEVLGYTEEEFRRDFRDILTDNAVNQAAEQHLATLLAGENAPGYQLEVRHRDGSPRRLEVVERPLRDGGGAVVGVEGVACDISDRIAETERMRSLLDSTPDGMVIVDGDGIIRMINDRSVELLGYRREELLGQPVELLVPEEVRGHHAGLRSAFTRHATVREMGADLSLSARRKDGTTFPVEISLSPVQLAEDRWVCAAVRDITDKVEARRAIRESQAFLQAVIDNSTALIYAKDLNGVYLLTNREWSRMLDLPGDAVGRTDHDLFPKEFADKFVANDRAVVESREAVSTEEIAQVGGETRTYLSVKFPILDEAGSPTAVCGISTDITERKLAETRGRALGGLRQVVWGMDSSSELDTILLGLQAALHELSVEYDVVGVNIVADPHSDPPRILYRTIRPGQAWRGGVFGEVAARTVTDIWRKGDVAYRRDIDVDALADSDRTERALDGSEQTRRSIIDVPFSHGTLALNSHRTNAFDDHVETLKSVARILGEAFTRLDDLQALRDRTQQAEEARSAADDANASKSIFLANMSHEIRTPMNAILGFAEILGGLIRDPQQRHYLTTIQTSGRALLGLINDILDLSKVEAGKLELEYTATDVGQVFGDMEHIFAQRVGEKGIDLEVVVDPRVPRALLTDETRLRQILVNLVGNAVKFTDEGGVRLTLMVGSPEVHPGSRIDLVLEVSDTGVGIPEDQQDKIFGAFEQTAGQSFTKFGGTGLGLAITKRLIEMMNGTVTVSSVVGEGSTFTVSLPGVEVASVHELAEADQGPDIDGIEFSPARILIVDDVDTNRHLAKAYLGAYSFELLEATNGEEAVEQTRRYAPDLVIMDMRMPVMSGYEATTILKQDASTRDIPVLALTASVMAHHEEQVRRLCDGYLRKPATRAQLVNEVARFVEHRRRKEPQAEVPVVASSAVRLHERASEAALAALEAERSAWQELVDTLTINDIEEFARRMQHLGEGQAWQALTDWGQRLEQQASSFDLGALPATLAEYETLVDGTDRT